MKQLAVLLLAGIVFFGCSSNSPLNPEQDKNFNFKRIQLPQPKDLGVEFVLQDSEKIKGSIGGDLEIVGAYASTSGVVAIESELLVPAGAFNGAKWITLKHEGLFVDVELYPHMEFDTPVFLNVKMTGLDLSDITDPSTVKFVYFAPDGSIEPIAYENMVVDLQAGVLEVENAKLEHFSRYGWAK